MNEPLTVDEFMQFASDQIRSLENRIFALHEHKIRQIDENRKLSRGIDELRKTSEDEWDNINTRLTELEEWTRKDEDRIYERIKIIEDFIGQNYVRDIKKIESSLKILSDQLSFCAMNHTPTVESMLENNMDKKPHKCPLCEGRGKQSALKMDGVLLVNVAVCNACEGIGIVWG